MVVLTLTLGTAFQGEPVFTLHGDNSAILIHFPRFWPLLDSMHILWEATVNFFTIRGRLTPVSHMCAKKECLSHQLVALLTAVQD